MEIEFIGERADELSADFFRWLRNESLPGIVLERKNALPKPGAMGPEWLPIITAALASPLVLDLVKSFEGWLFSRKPRIKVIWRGEDGAVFEMETDDIGQIKKLPHSIHKKLFPNQS
jgi:hypothetical protein